jgi:hypothetical protein
MLGHWFGGNSLCAEALAVAAIEQQAKADLQRKAKGSRRCSKDDAMKPFKHVKQSIRREGGFVSVEWIALAASLAVAAVAIGFMVIQSGAPMRDPVARELVQSTDGTGGATREAPVERQTLP